MLQENRCGCVRADTCCFERASVSFCCMGDVLFLGSARETGQSAHIISRSTQMDTI